MYRRPKEDALDESKRAHIINPKTCRQNIAVRSDRDASVELYVARARGGTLLRATNSGVAESQPTWSPEGDRLAYTSPDADGKPQIYWLRLSDLIPHRLQFRSESEVDPAWSPKGVWIAFVSLDADGRSETLDRTLRTLRTLFCVPILISMILCLFLAPTRQN